MGETPSPEAITPHEIPIPPDVSKAYAKGIHNLIGPNLAAAKEAYAQIPSETNEDKDFFRSEMGKSLDDAKTLLEALEEKKIAVKEINDGWDFAISEEDNTVTVEPIAYPIHIDPSLKEQFKSALRHRFAHTAAALTYAEMLADSPAKAAFDNQKLQVLQHLQKVYTAKDLTIVLDKDGESQLQFEGLREPITIDPSMANALGAGLKTYLAPEMASVQATIGDNTSPFGPARNISRLQQTLSALQTANTVSLRPLEGPSVQPDDYELVLSEDKHPEQPITDTVIEEHLVGPLGKSIVRTLDVYADGLLQNAKTLDSETLRDAASVLKTKIHTLDMARKIEIVKNDQGAVELKREAA